MQEPKSGYFSPSVSTGTNIIEKFTTNIVSVCSIKKAFYSCEVKKCWSSRILLKWKQHTNLFPRKIPFYFIINPHNCIYESIKSPFPHVVVFFLLIVVICFVIFKVNHGYQTIEDCKVYVTYKHRHCQTAKGEQEREGGREGTAQVLLAIFYNCLIHLTISSASL